jgi:peptidoglycan/xylan/chitin deacetylase (PgdA/CDA1 family)
VRTSSDERWDSVKKQKIGKKPRPLYQKLAFLLLKVGGVAAIGVGVYVAYGLYGSWQLGNKSAELSGLHLYSVQESNYTNAFSWYASYPKIDEPAFDTVVAKIANDAKGSFLAKVNFQAKTEYPKDDLNVSYKVNSYDDKKLSVSVTSRRVLGDARSNSTKKVTYDREKQKVESVRLEKEPSVAEFDKVVPGKVPKAERSGAECAKQKCVALTFNDGPSPSTPQILDTLGSNHAKATFFEVGAQARLYPSIAQRVINEGHVIGSLGFDHRNLAAASFSDVVGDINRGEDAIEKASGVRPGLVRAPYGAITKDLAQKVGMPVIGWMVDTKDGTSRQSEAIYNEVMSKVRPGTVVVSRDTQAFTAKAYKRIIPDLLERGYTLVTIPQLLDFKGDEQAGIYAN